MPLQGYIRKNRLNLLEVWKFFWKNVIFQKKFLVVADPTATLAAIQNAMLQQRAAANNAILLQNPVLSQALALRNLGRVQEFTN